MINVQLITAREQIRTVADRFESQYRNNGPEYRCSDGRDPRMILHALRALDPEKATAADVEHIIGNDSWICFYCDGCMEKVAGPLIQLPQGGKYCATCLEVMCRAMGWTVEVEK